ncbi:hypothetical protein LTR24_007847 [Lithohypha guttulata]|uniref:Ubiquitin-like domain-containing protein n=1 Tax=Lithohypha guttulata TaxID=1690604 RepID=A0ABR0K291_9EURO|nr:hypothetical protein LTR24_007847 [Lithohypha guttulata]
MANDELSTKVYGDIHVGGHAHVQLGDRILTRHNHYHVRGVYVSTRERRKRGGSVQTRYPQITQRANGKTIHARRWNDANHLDKRRNQVGGSSSCARQAYEDVTVSTAAWTGVLSQAQSASRLVLNALAQRADWKHIRQTILHLHKTLIRKQPVVKTLSPHMHGNAVDGYPGYLTNSSAAGETVTATPSTQQQTQARRDVLMFCAAVLTLMLGRDISAQDVLEVLSRCQHDQLMPALTFLFGIGTCGYIARASATQHYVTLEDAYGHPRTVTMDSCMDFDILRKFLEVHYRQTNGKAGEALIRAGRFHLMLGSRRGRVIDAQEWAVYHRDYDTFRSTVGDKATLSQGREAEEQNEQRPYDGLSPLTGSELIRAEDFNSGSNTNYRIDGLQNVDVRIVARPKVHDYPYSRGVSSLRRSKRPSTNSSRNSMASNQNARLSRNRYPSILIPQNSWQEHDAIKDVALGISPAQTIILSPEALSVLP